MKYLDDIIWLICGWLLLLAGAGIGYCTSSKFSMYNAPYHITMEHLSDRDLRVCRVDPNCMDINTFGEEK